MPDFPRTARRTIASLSLRAGRRLPKAVRRALAQVGQAKAEVGAAPAGRAARRLISQARTIQVRSDARLEISGWVFRKGVASDCTDAVVLVAIGPEGVEPIRWPASRRVDEEVDRADADPTMDRSGAGFVAVVDLTTLVASAPRTDHRWRIEVELRDAEGLVQEPFGTVASFSAAGAVPAQPVGRRAIVFTSVSVSKAGAGADGLVLQVQRPESRARRVRLDGETLRIRLSRSARFHPVRAVLVQSRQSRSGKRSTAGRRVPLQLDPVRLEVRLDVTRLQELGADAAGRWTVELSDPFGHRRTLRWAQPAERPQDEGPTRPGYRVLSSPTGLLRLDWGSEAVQAVQAEVVPGAPPRLRLLLTGLSGPASVWLAGERQRVEAESVSETAEGTAVTFALHDRAPFAAPDTDLRRPLTSGRYRVLVCPTPGPARGEMWFSIGVGRHLAARMGERADLDLQSVRIERGRAGEFAVRLSAPRAPGLAGRFRMLQLADRIGSSDQPIEDAVLFDCFSGKFTGDNPGAIRDELMNRRPDLDEYWVVSDHAVPVPEGAVPVIWYSPEYFRARWRSRFLVTNCWLTGGFRRRDGQRVMQTWHGTPFKRLGFERLGPDQSAEYRTSLTEQTNQWNCLISQNRYSTEIFTRTYAYRGRVAEIGYPRDDVLTRDPGREHRQRVRARLGLRPGERAVLFAPTWREDGRQATRGLDFVQLRRRLDLSYRVLVRGHANTLRSGSDVRTPGVIDVTSYPEITDLFLVAEVMVTDYSSVMFDFTITGKPVVFFVPDLDDYADRTRGTYFDLESCAPGPLVADTDGVAGAIIQARDGVPEDYAERYRAWVERFNPFDDGRASERAVDLLLGEGHSG